MKNNNNSFSILDESSNDLTTTTTTTTTNSLNSLSISRSGFVGLMNQGATCYLNSLLQTLYMTPEFRASLFSISGEDLNAISNSNSNSNSLSSSISSTSISNITNAIAAINLNNNEENINSNSNSNHSSTSSSSTKKPRKIPIQLQKLFTFLYTSQENAISTTELTDSFGWKDNNEVYHQHDVSELNRILLDAIDRSLKGIHIKFPSNIKINNISTLNKNNNQNNNNNNNNNELIGALYRGTLCHQLKCLKCFNTSDRLEPMYDISLPVQGFSSLESSLNNYLQIETLNGDNQWKCGQCETKVDAERRTLLHSLPPILTFCLSRFRYDWDTGRRYKVNDRFEFPMELDLTDYVNNNNSENKKDNDDSKNNNKNSKNEQDLYQYELLSVIIHRGSGANQGHYHAYIRDFTCQGQWKEPSNNTK